MSDVFKNKPTTGFWIVSVLALLWNIMGVFAYLTQVYDKEGYRANLNEAQLTILESTPAWVTGAFATAVFTALVGSILLLVKKKLAKLFFVISFLAIIAEKTYTLGFTDAKKYFIAFDWFLVLSVPVIAVLLILFSKKAISRHWIT